MAENYITRISENGSINISDDVIAVMVAAAISEIDGVAGLSNTIGSEIADFIGRKNVTKGVKVQFSEESVTVDVIVMVRFGTNISEVGANIQEAVVSAIDSMTGLACTVNVHISGISYEK